ncbi:MAG: peptidyl-prolyl cis-trans isomerase [Zetaproteobacteria bacterium CG2_30_46_52]|nr:MAG: peptidyl-prolyl cis-trans isomerase [Zetaproteobacteria bacterium CG2_30_46_52]
MMLFYRSFALAFAVMLGLSVLMMTPATAEQTTHSATQHNHGKEKHMSENNVVTIELETGTVTLELYPDVAPKTVESFKKLINQGFYDGLTFHRVIPGFMAQGGDPDGTGMGGPGFKLKAEFNDKKHVRGTLAMARTADPDSAGSQFYICYGPQPHLDHQYTIFGQVTDGMELIDGVKNGSVMKKLTVVGE